ncbi:hypothetical protein [Synechococcus sp. CBW1004]|jgi:hypothetical protein|uniref:hypothetical protein n=1 Tax=Synechococcus sp. CBW1004 TaxID=1353136 RepID=UPI0018CE8EBA|nr:hypothetical protein [Synechococcus sp. CBW1004]QPN61992.1 hypothetical protein H8F25_09285 [Synechococcus sp. CBW1004]
MIYSTLDGVADGITKAVNCAILLTTTSAQTASCFLDGTPKIVVTFWEGDPFAGTQKDFDHQRGDGRVQIIPLGGEGDLLPPNRDLRHPDSNIRAGVPMWLLKSADAYQDHPYVLGIGALHPRWSSATLDLYCPSTRQRLCRTYFGDPRRDFNQPQPDWPSFQEQKTQIREAGGMPDRGPDMAPDHPGIEDI